MFSYIQRCVSSQWSKFDSLGCASWVHNILTTKVHPKLNLSQFIKCTNVFQFSKVQVIFIAGPRMAQVLRSFIVSHLTHCPSQKSMKSRCKDKAKQCMSAFCCWRFLPFESSKKSDIWGYLVTWGCSASPAILPFKTTKVCWVWVASNWGC